MVQVKPKMFIRYFLSILLFIACVTARSQPSYQVKFDFKFYENGEVVDYENFKRNYELLGWHNRKDHVPWVNKHIKKKYFYIDSTQYFRVGGSVVYNPLIRKIVHDSDTMVLVIPSMVASPRGTTIDSLVFKPGYYFVIGKHLKYLDHEKAAKDYEESGNVFIPNIQETGN